jgi:hypothetical protein
VEWFSTGFQRSDWAKVFGFDAVAHVMGGSIISQLELVLPPKFSASHFAEIDLS